MTNLHRPAHGRARGPRRGPVSRARPRPRPVGYADSNRSPRTERSSSHASSTRPRDPRFSLPPPRCAPRTPTRSTRPTPTSASPSATSPRRSTGASPTSKARSRPTPARPEASSVVFTIKATSIDTNNSHRDNDLRSDNFFDVAKFPEITFKSSKIAATGKDTYAVTGTFTMHGVSKEVTLPVTYLGSMKDPRRQRARELRAQHEAEPQGLRHQLEPQPRQRQPDAVRRRRSHRRPRDRQEGARDAGGEVAEITRGGPPTAARLAFLDPEPRKR